MSAKGHYLKISTPHGSECFQLLKVALSVYNIFDGNIDIILSVTAYCVILPPLV